MALTLLTTNTNTSDSYSDFTSLIDSTYKLYLFSIYDFGPETDSIRMEFDGSTDSSSWSYGVTKTTSYWDHNHTEGDATELTYEAADDIANATTFARISRNIGSVGDESGAGHLWLFDPSNTTFNTHFYSCIGEANVRATQNMVGGYFNTTSAIKAVRFQAHSGDFDAVIKMYGVG